MDHLLEIDSLKQHIHLLTRQRDEAIIQIRELHHQLNGVSGGSDTKYKYVEYINRFLGEKTGNNMRPDEENEMLKYEMKELLKEMESCQKRRDQAFNERDKMLKERESIRALCDEMRHQRDKAISELAEALHESDELKKAKALAYRQIQMLEDSVGVLEEKPGRALSCSRLALLRGQPARRTSLWGRRRPRLLRQAARRRGQLPSPPRPRSSRS